MLLWFCKLFVALDLEKTSVRQRWNKAWLPSSVIVTLHIIVLLKLHWEVKYILRRIALSSLEVSSNCIEVWNTDTQIGSDTHTASLVVV